jgi:hypothetical protein
VFDDDADDVLRISADDHLVMPPRRRQHVVIG